MEFIVTDENFEKEVLESEMPVLVDFYADWCGPCKMMAPIIESLSQELDGKVRVCKMNIDDNMETPQKYRVMSIPTFLVFQNGEVKESIVGVVSKEELLGKL